MIQSIRQFCLTLRDHCRRGGHRFWGTHGLLRDHEFKEALSQERSRAERTGLPLSLVILWEVEPKGTATLRGSQLMGSLVKVLKKRIRCTDMVGCLDGGRVGLLLPHTCAESAWAVLRDAFDRISASCCWETIAERIVYRVYTSEERGEKGLCGFESRKAGQPGVCGPDGPEAMSATQSTV